MLAVVEGAGEALEPSVIAERLLVTTGTMTSLSTPLKSEASSAGYLTPATAASCW